MTNRDYRDLLAAFCDHEVRFLIVGGYAVTFHARPRFTKDLDLWVDPVEANARRVVAALQAFGAPLNAHGVSVADFVQPGTVYQLGVAPSRIDILTSVEGLEFAACWSARVASTYGDVTVNYLSVADLITNKRTLGRPQDLLDVEALERR
jgi:hypothetical protein